MSANRPALRKTEKRKVGYALNRGLAGEVPPTVWSTARDI